MPRVRLTSELVSRGFFEDEDTAARAVMAGEVSTCDRRLEHPGEQVTPGLELHVKNGSAFVSRGGIKLEAALHTFDVDVHGKNCMDVGCSTGGFTDCLLQHGAAHVVALDVGYAQFDWGLRQDARVELLERTNMRDMAVPERESTIDLCVADVSFTSITTLLSAIRSVLKDSGEFICLVKPQFECSREQVGEGGIVSDPAAHEAAIERVKAGCSEVGLEVIGVVDSPITGHKGNKEFLLFARA